MELAKEYAEFNHPRKGGPGGAPFPLYSTTLGRYCVLGGCGEQLDLWDEGQVSELSIYGPGLTNYFKTLVSPPCVVLFGLASTSLNVVLTHTPIHPRPNHFPQNNRSGRRGRPSASSSSTSRSFCSTPSGTARPCRPTDLLRVWGRAHWAT